jgi:hypothetical protein
MRKKEENELKQELGFKGLRSNTIIVFNFYGREFL